MKFKWTAILTKIREIDARYGDLGLDCVAQAAKKRDAKGLKAQIVRLAKLLHGDHKPAREHLLDVLRMVPGVSAQEVASFPTPFDWSDMSDPNDDDFIDWRCR